MIKTAMHIPKGYPWTRPLLLAVLIAVSFGAGYYFHKMSDRPTEPHTQVRQSGYLFSRPLLDCSVSQQNSSNPHPDLQPFREIVQRVVDEHLVDKSALTIFVYFRDLNSAYSFGAGENKTFPPASLMKVPLMIGILKRAEKNPSLLQRKIKYENGPDDYRRQIIKPKETLRQGSYYTVDDLLYRMIAYSDNDSWLLLGSHFGMDLADKTMAELDIPVVITSNGLYRISLRNYSAFFRILYNASYLNNDMSEKALAYLARSTFENGIREVLPRGIFVASKFGEYDDDNRYYLNEVGIVYYRDHPYLLGVVTNGGTQESLCHVIQEVSKAVYQELDRQHKTAVPATGSG